MQFSFRRLVFGKPLPTWRAAHERLPKILALPVFASDAMSSVAYATGEILIVLALAGGMRTNLVFPVTVAIVALLAIVATSYRQTIFAYPSGGGSYIVAKENLGTYPGLVAAAALLIDYVLTVSVSIAAGVDALISAFPALGEHKVLICIACILIVTLGNLRGVKESGALFAFPTYIFIGSFLTMIGVGLFRALVLHTLPAHPPVYTKATEALSLYLILRAFAAGCTAMTGTEAVSNGIPAFKKPESKNAAITLVWMAIILATLFLGNSWLAGHLGILAPETTHGQQTVSAQIAQHIFGRCWFYYVIQFSTMLILILAANTSYADFPRLSSLLARDRFLPRQLSNVGDRLVFTNGILALASFAILLIVGYKGEVNRLIPLYAIGVFISFTLSQSGMVVHTLRLKERGWKLGAAISGFGAVTTAVVSVVLMITKLDGGSWIVMILIPILVFIFHKIHQHYITLAKQLRLPEDATALQEMKSTVLIVVPGIHNGVLPAIQYAKSLAADCRGVYIEVEPEMTPLVEDRWEQWGQGIPLVVLESPYRSIIQPLLSYLNEVKEERVRHMVTVVIPEFVPAKKWHAILHNQNGALLKLALLFRRDIVVANIRYYLEH